MSAGRENKTSDKLKVEHYQRKAVRYYDQQPPGETEVCVSSASRTQDHVRKASAVLEDRSIVTVTGSGTVCSRVVTVSEIMKKKYKKSGIKQECKIKYLKTEDVWQPTKEGLDPLRVVKRIPFISITMEITPAPSLQPSSSPSASQQQPSSPSPSQQQPSRKRSTQPKKTKEQT